MINFPRLLLLSLLLLISAPAWAIDDPLADWQHQAVTLIATKRCLVADQAVQIRACAAMMEIGRLDTMPYLECGDNALGYKADNFTNFFIRVDSLAKFLRQTPDLQPFNLAVIFENKSERSNRAWVRRFNEYTKMYRSRPKINHGAGS